MLTERQTMRMPRRELVGSMGAGGLLGGLVAAGVVAALAGGSPAATGAALVVLLGVVLTIWPVLLLGRVALTTFASSVLMIGTLRLLVILGIGLVLDLTQGYPRVAFWMGVVGGATVVLLVETTTLLVLVKRIGREPATGGDTAIMDGGSRA